MSTERIVPALQKAIAKPSDEYVLTAAPDRSTTIAHQTYGPIVDYLSQVTGKRIVYRHSPDWRTYQQAMQQGEYDLAFDGSHFVSWRISRLEHEPLVKAAQEDIFVVLASKRDHHLNSLQDLAGRSVCGHAPPHYTTLRVYHEFDNPARQPVLIRERSWQAIYQAMITGKCDGAIMSLEGYHQVDPDGRHARIVFKSKAIPGKTLTAGPHLSPEDKAAITRALLSPEGRKVTKRLRQQLGITKITRATKSEYAGLDTILHGVWGFHI
ncbi:MAG: phosphate/phosphite/phosphonate ABC transporter substrate-binding protein [Acidiferrobacterales bacterium]|jgi:ABC-type phosphate/phosphonate transport system substrate-binding protein